MAVQTVTQHRLRQLAKLHREGVDGAGAALVTLAESNPVALADALGRTESWVHKVRCSEEAADIMVAAIGEASHAVRAQRLEKARSRAEAIAEVLASELQLTDEGHVLIPGDRLAELAAAGGYHFIGLPAKEDVRVLETSLLRQAFRECNGVRRLGVSLAPLHLLIEYETPLSRGHLVFRTDGLHRLHEDVLVVPRRFGIQEEPEPVTAPKPPVPSPAPPMHPFLRHFFGALTEWMG